MAATADQLTEIYYRNAESYDGTIRNLRMISPLVEVDECSPTPDVVEIGTEFMAYSADASPWLRGVRQQARAEAERIYEKNRLARNEGRFEELPLDVDALGTADKTDRIAEVFGAGSPEHRQARHALWQDCHRKVGEILSKLKPKWFAPFEQHYRPETGETYVDGLSLDEMMENGLTSLAPAEESQLRTNDFVLHATRKQILQHPSANELGFVGIKPCPDYIIHEYHEHPKGSHRGYVPSIEKLAIGYDSFDYESGRIFTEFVYAPGLYITPAIMTSFLNEVNAAQADNTLERTEIHATHVVISKSQIGNAVDVLKILDSLASKQHGIEIFLGMPLAPGNEKDYDQLYNESGEDAVLQNRLTDQLVKYVEELQAEGTDHALATYMVERFLQEESLQLAQNDPDFAAVVFDKPTADGFREIKRLVVAGRHEQARQLLEEVRFDAPAVSSCGPGECGLKSPESTAETGSIQKLLNLTPSEKRRLQILKDKERPCIKCGEKSVVYAFDVKTVKKGCTSCGTTQNTTVPAKPRQNKDFTFFSSASRRVSKVPERKAA